NPDRVPGDRRRRHDRDCDVLCPGIHREARRVLGADRNGVGHMPYRTDTFRIAMAGPAHMTGLAALIGDRARDPLHIAAILVKTEGNGGVNDFTREYTCATMAATLAPYLRATNAEVERRIAMVVSGGTEGVLSPHATIFARVPAPIMPGVNGQAN